MNSSLKIVIMAGGKGQRLWPESNSKTPKQFLSLLSHQSLIQETHSRMNSILKNGISTAKKEMKSKENDIFFALGEKHVPLLKEHFPKLFPKKKITTSANSTKIIIEPQSKDTAAAIALSTLTLLRSGQITADDVLFFLPADATIADDKAFAIAINHAFSAAKNQNAMVLLAITPTRPATGFGYLKTSGLQKSSQQKSPTPIVKVKNFVEKPNLTTAKRYVKKTNYYWNSGMFFMKTQFILNAFSTHAPQHLKKINQYLDCLETNNTKKALSIFNQLEKISFDYAIAEKLFGNIFAVPVEMGWDDLGGYKALHRLQKKDINGNSVSPNTTLFNLNNANNSKANHKKKGEAIFFNSTDNYVQAGGKTVVLNQISGITVAVEQNTIYISGPEGEKDIKKLLIALEKTRKKSML